MNDSIIKIENLSKIYRLYAKPHYRFLDMLGLLGGANKYSEHAALHNISLEIKRGEKVGIIGRNGAGKSTLLKLISGIIEPSKGKIAITGSARALLEIGSGFHADFTGRENVFAYLAQMGVTGKQANDLLYDIIDFAELEEYIDQPIKTYSTGMKARLMFATSTAITPDLLILDEILSVGDAYFSHKCMERISELCGSQNSTLLLVSHDIYSASKLCDRMIWLDRGEILIDNVPLQTLKAYEDSVRQEEERRIRKKTLISLQNNNKTDDKLTIELCAPNRSPLPSNVYISKVVLKEDDNIIDELPLHENSQSSGTTELIQENNCWGEVERWQETFCKPMLNYGSNYHKVSGVFSVSDLKTKIGSGSLSIEVVCGSPKLTKLIIKLFVGEHLIANQLVDLADNKLQQSIIHLNENPASKIPHSETNNPVQYGNGIFQITNIRLRDKNSQFTTIIRHGEPAKFSINYSLRDKKFNGKADIILSILKDGIDTSCRMMCNSLIFNAKESPNGIINIDINSLNLGAARYSITALIGKSGYNEKTDHKFFSINEDLYFFARDVFTFDVVDGGLVALGTPYVAQASWTTQSRLKNKEALDA